MTEDQPLLRVVRGAPDEVELAALAAVVASLRSPASAAEPAARTSWWAERRALVRGPLSHGPGAWRASGLPR